MRERFMNRRRLLSGVAAAGVGAALPTIPAASAAQGKAVVNGRIRQSVVFWCFNAMGDRWDLERTCRVASDLGCQSVEIVPPDQWKVLRKYNLTCAIAPNGIAFSGYKWRDADDPKSGEISKSDGADNMVRGLRPVIEHAVKRRVTVCIEHL